MPCPAPTPRTTRTTRLLALAFLCAMPLLGAPCAAQTSRPALLQATAQRIAAGCEAYARPQGWQVAVAVNDETGQLRHVSRMDGAPPISVAVARLKADTAWALPISTRPFREAARSNEGAERLARITTVAGGPPFLGARGVALGSAGVSGMQQAQDEACAQAGLDAVREALR